MKHDQQKMTLKILPQTLVLYSMSPENLMTFYADIFSNSFTAIIGFVFSVLGAPTITSPLLQVLSKLRLGKYVYVNKFTSIIPSFLLGIIFYNHGSPTRHG